MGTMSRVHETYQPWQPYWMQEGLHQQQRELGRHLQEQQAHQLHAEEVALQASRMLLSLCTPLEGPRAVLACILCLLTFPLQGRSLQTAAFGALLMPTCMLCLARRCNEVTVDTQLPALPAGSSFGGMRQENREGGPAG